MELQIIHGPSASKVTKEAAEAQLRSHPAFPKNASVMLDVHEGHWVAAIAKVAEFGDEHTGEPSEPEAEAPDAPDEAPSDDAPESPDEDDSNPFSDEKKEDGDKEEKGEKGELKQLLHLVTTLLTALGINPDAGEGDSPIPGLDAPGPDGPPADGPPPGPPSDGSGDEKQHIVHERAMKPGDIPPGSTPVGAPAFASVKVADDHPWKDIIGEKRSFPVEETISDDESLADVKQELDSLAEGTGYQVKQLVEARNASGQRTAKALISR